MKFLLDNDIPDALSYLLRELGHDVSLLRDVIPKDAPDATVLQFANDNQAVLVTCNRDDFVELANHQTHHGIVIVIRRKTGAAEPDTQIQRFGAQVPRPVGSTWT